MKKILKNFLFNNENFQKISSSCVANKNLLPNILCRTPSNEIRKIFNLPQSKHKTQLNQDIFALLMNTFQKELYFVEIGANDGFDLSNTIYLEEKFNWTGLLIEPNPNYFESLTNRKSKHVPFAVPRIGSAFWTTDSAMMSE